MANLVRWDPFNELTPLRQMMNRLMEEAWVRPPTLWSQDSFGQVGLDMYENDDEYVVSAALPGLKPEDLEITAQGNLVTISGETKSEEPASGEQRTYHMRESHYGRFSRQVTLPASVQTDRIQASLDNGVLTLHIPKAEEVKPRRIQVQGGTGSVQQIGSPTANQNAA
jgi:HSP20 family protein